MSARNEILLGAHTYTVRPQKIGYLIHRLGPNLKEALELEFDGLDGAKLVTAKAHSVLAVLIPDLMPLHEFLGYASEEAMAAGDYREGDDNSPEPLQVKMAFKAASDVNGGEVLKHLKALMGPTLWEKLVAFLMARLAESGPLSTISAPSPTSPPPSGTSPSTNSGTSPQTTTPPVSAA